MTRSNKQLVVQWAGYSTILLVGLIARDHNSVRCQFLQPQSHLGRLVQSITSPLVLASSSSGDSDSSYDPESSGPESGSVDSSQQQYPGQQQLTRGYYQQQQQREEDVTGGPQHFQQYRAQHQHRAAGLQQAPSQQQHQQHHGGGQDDEDSGAPTNNRHHRQQAGADGGEQYQMGAYLGPAMDDKEIQGAFSSNDDRDDDEAAGYEGPPREGARGQQQTDGAGYAPQAGGRASTMMTMGQRGEQANFDDELGADEDDEPAAGSGRRQPRFKSSSSANQAAAASQFHQRNQPTYPRAARQQSGSLMAAANGYSPMGAAGPFDLSGLMAAAGGAQAYEVYNGDGSYPGPGYYPQQQQGNQRGQGRRSQAASMNSPYGYGQYGPVGYGPPQQQQQQGGSNADQDDAEDED